MWIPVYQELTRHPKMKRLSRKLNISQPQAIGHLIFLWSWATDFTPDGNLGKYDIEDISCEAGWEGDPQEFINALLDCNFIEKENENLIIHDWDDYAGKFIKEKEKEADRKRKSREKNKEIPFCPPDIHRTSNGHLTDGSQTATVDKIREDNNREDNIIQEEKISEEVEEIYSKLTGNRINPADVLVITKIVTSIDAPKEKQVLIDTIKNCISCGVKYKQKKGENIGSFNYFSKAILSEFKKMKNDIPSNGKKKKQQWVIDVEKDEFLTPEQKELILSGQ